MTEGAFFGRQWTAWPIADHLVSVATGKKQSAGKKEKPWPPLSEQGAHRPQSYDLTNLTVHDVNEWRHCRFAGSVMTGSDGRKSAMRQTTRFH